MSDVNLDFTVNNNSINFTVEPNDITFTPSDVQLNIYAGGVGVPGGGIGQIQFNAGNVLSGTANLVYDAVTGATIVSNLVSTTKTNLGAVSTITITGGSANYALTTDGAGNLSWAQVSNATTANFANYAGNVLGISQPNITSLGNLINLTSNGNVNFTGASNVSLGSSSNVKITGGNNGYYLQTDGTGNISWVAGGGSGNGVVGGSNTQIQFNDGGSFGGNAGFTFNKIAGDLLIPNSVSAPITKLTAGTENISLIAAQTGTYNFDFYSNAIKLTTSNATANLTLNFRGNSTISANTLLSNGQSITGTYVMSTDSTAYAVTAVQVDNVPQTIKWATGSPPFTFANSLMSYTFTIIKTSTTPTYTVLGSGTRYA